MVSATRGIKPGRSLCLVPVSCFPFAPPSSPVEQTRREDKRNDEHDLPRAARRPSPAFPDPAASSSVPPPCTLLVVATVQMCPELRTSALEDAQALPTRCFQRSHDLQRLQDRAPWPCSLLAGAVELFFRLWTSIPGDQNQLRALQAVLTSLGSSQVRLSKLFR